MPPIRALPDCQSGSFASRAKTSTHLSTTSFGSPGRPHQRGPADDLLHVGIAGLAKDPDWQSGNARIGGIAAIRSPAETERFVREQYELYDKLVTSLGIRQ